LTLHVLSRFYLKSTLARGPKFGVNYTSNFLLALAWMRRPAQGKPDTIAIASLRAARASFLAQVHPASGLEEWLTSVIRERIELEEEALAEAKRDLSEKREA